MVLNKGPNMNIPSKEELLLLKDKPFKHIASIYNTDTATVKVWYNIHDIPKIGIKGVPLSSPIPPKEILEQLKHLSFDEIAKQYNTNPTTISRYFKRYNIERTNLQGTHLKSKEEIPSKEELLSYQDKTYKQIAEIYNTSHTKVSVWFKKHNINRKPEKCKKHIKKPITQTSPKPITQTSPKPINDFRIALINKILSDDSFTLSLYHLLKDSL